MNEILAALAIVIAKQEQEINRLSVALRIAQESPPSSSAPEPQKRPTRKR